MKNNKKSGKKSEGVEVMSSVQENKDPADLQKQQHVQQSDKQQEQSQNKDKQVEEKEKEKGSDKKLETRLSKKNPPSSKYNNEAVAPLTPSRPVVINKPTTSQQQLVLTPVPYQSTFVNASRPLPYRNTPVPNGWEDSTIVKQISTYSKKYLRDIHDPKYKDKYLQVGKPSYIEEGMTFDEQPSLLQESAPHMTGVNVVQREASTQEKVNLWRKFNNEEFKGHYKEVNFNSQDPHSRNYNSGIDDIIVQQPVRINLTNKKSSLKGLVDRDPILENTINPVRRVVFTKDRVNEIAFDEHQQQNKNNRDLKKVNQINKQGDEVRMSRFIHPEQVTRRAN